MGKETAEAVCAECGAWLDNEEVHYMWHREIEARLGRVEESYERP